MFVTQLGGSARRAQCQVIPRMPYGPSTPAPGKCHAEARSISQRGVTAMRTLFPCPPIRFLGSLSSSTLDANVERTYDRVLPNQTVRHEPQSIPDLGSAVIVAQCGASVKTSIFNPWVVRLWAPRSRPTRGPTGSATAAGRPPPALAVAPQSALCEGWPVTGTLVRKTPLVKPRRLRTDDDRIILNPLGLVKSLGKVRPFCS